MSIDINWKEENLKRFANDYGLDPGTVLHVMSKQRKDFVGKVLRCENFREALILCEMIEREDLKEFAAQKCAELARSKEELLEAANIVPRGGIAWGQCVEELLHSNLRTYT